MTCNLNHMRHTSQLIFSSKKKLHNALHQIPVIRKLFCFMLLLILSKLLSRPNYSIRFKFSKNLLDLQILNYSCIHNFG